MESIKNEGTTFTESRPSQDLQEVPHTASLSVPDGDDATWNPGEIEAEKRLKERKPSPHSKKVMKHALRQQAKRRRKNTTIAAGNPAPIQRHTISPNACEIDEVNCDTACYRQPTMAEVLASIPGFSMKPRKRSQKKLSAAAQLEQTKEGCVDLETPDSILVHSNLRSLLNKHTFSCLPSLYQYKLLQLLPHVDRTGNDSVFRLSGSGLNNEFFARACLDWRERLAEGEFTPENQAKIKAEQEREKSKLDPWKLKHFEPTWGESLKEWPQLPASSSTTTSPLTSPTAGGGGSQGRPTGAPKVVKSSPPPPPPPAAPRVRTVGAVTRAVTSYREKRAAFSPPRQHLEPKRNRPSDQEKDDNNPVSSSSEMAVNVPVTAVAECELKSDESKVDLNSESPAITISIDSATDCSNAEVNPEKTRSEIEYIILPEECRRSSPPKERRNSAEKTIEATVSPEEDTPEESQITISIISEQETIETEYNFLKSPSPSATALSPSKSSEITSGAQTSPYSDRTSANFDAGTPSPSGTSESKDEPCELLAKQEEPEQSLLFCDDLPNPEEERNQDSRSDFHHDSMENDNSEPPHLVIDCVESPLAEQDAVNTDEREEHNELRDTPELSPNSSPQEQLSGSESFVSNNFQEENTRAGSQKSLNSISVTQRQDGNERNYPNQLHQFNEGTGSDNPDVTDSCEPVGLPQAFQKDIDLPPLLPQNVQNSEISKEDDLEIHQQVSEVRHSEQQLPSHLFQQQMDTVHHHQNNEISIIRQSDDQSQLIHQETSQSLQISDQSSQHQTDQLHSAESNQDQLPFQQTNHPQQQVKEDELLPNIDKNLQTFHHQSLDQMQFLHQQRNHSQNHHQALQVQPPHIQKIDQSHTEQQQVHIDQQLINQQHLDQAVNQQQLNSSIHQQLNSSVHHQQLSQAAHQQQLHLTVQHQQLDESVHHPQINNSIHQQQLTQSVQESQQLDPSDHQGQFHQSIQHQQLNQQQINQSGYQEQLPQYVHQQQLDHSSHQEQLHQSVHQQKLDHAVHQQQLHQPVHQQQLNQPVHQEQLHIPVHQQHLEQSTHPQQINQPIHHPQLDQSVHQQLLEQSVQQHQLNQTVHHQQLNQPAHQQRVQSFHQQINEVQSHRQFNQSQLINQQNNNLVQEPYQSTHLLQHNENQSSHQINHNQPHQQLKNQHHLPSSQSRNHHVPISQKPMLQQVNNQIQMRQHQLSQNQLVSDQNNQSFVHASQLNQTHYLPQIEQAQFMSQINVSQPQAQQEGSLNPNQIHPGQQMEHSEIVQQQQINSFNQQIEQRRHLQPQISQGGNVQHFDPSMKQNIMMVPQVVLDVNTSNHQTISLPPASSEGSLTSRNTIVSIPVSNEHSHPNMQVVNEPIMSNVPIMSEVVLPDISGNTMLSERASVAEEKWEVIQVNPEKSDGIYFKEEEAAILAAAWDVVGSSSHFQDLQPPVSVIPCQEEIKVRLQESSLPAPQWVEFGSSADKHITGHVKLELEVTLTPEVDSQVSSSSAEGGGIGEGVRVIPPTTIVCLPPLTTSAPPPPPPPPPATSSAIPYLALTTSTPVRAVPTKPLQTKSSGRGGRGGSSKPPPGAVNFERSYQICQAVIQNSPNRHQLRAQLKPPPQLIGKKVSQGGVSGVGGQAPRPRPRGQTVVLRHMITNAGGIPVSMAVLPSHHPQGSGGVRRSNSAPPTNSESQASGGRGRPASVGGPGLSCGGCSLRPLIPCQSCGDFCHEDCITPARICITCDSS